VENDFLIRLGLAKLTIEQDTRWSELTEAEITSIIDTVRSHSWMNCSVIPAPKDRMILVYGNLHVLPENKKLYFSPEGLIVSCAVWDDVDDEFGLIGGTFAGPWIKPKYWMELPYVRVVGE
jgi:hypothetical protein